MDKKDLIHQWLKVKYEKMAQAEKTPKTILKWILWFILFCIALGTAVIVIFILIIFPTLPDINNIQNLVFAQSSSIYDREGNLLYTIHGEENRENVKLADVSPSAVQAVLSIEDYQFYSHGGVDLSGLMAAICGQIHLCSDTRGGSTITQQFIKNAYLTNERTYTRKLKEMVLSWELENKFTKDQILEMYLNRIPYGSSIYGIQQASMTFFGKPAKDLTLAEGAVLASIPKAPTFYSPYGDNRYASITLSEDEILKMKIKSEQQIVDINPDFVVKGLLGKTYYYGGVEAPAPGKTDSGSDKTSDKKKPDSQPSNPENTELTSDETPKIGATAIYVKGRADYVLDRMLELKVITKDQYDKAIAEEQKIDFKPFREEIKAPHFVMYVKQLLEDKYGQDVVEKGGLKITTTLDPDLQTAAEKAVADHIEGNLKNYNTNNAALVAEDPNNGQILAMVGSADYWDDTIDGKVNVALRPRLPGSSFKPIVYAAAFLQGYAPSTVVYDVDTNFGGTYRPKNYDGTYQGPVSFRTALAHSLNIPAVKAGYLAGIQNVLDLARRMGIQLNQPDDWYGLSLAIGAGEARLLDMVGAYGIFANGGYKMDSVAILKVEDHNGNILEEYQQPVNRSLILDPQVCYLVNNVLSDSDARPEGWWRQQLTIPGQVDAAKTGTSNKEIKGVDYPFDTWTLGYTKRIVAGVWAGNTDGSILAPKADGLTTAAYMWHEFMVDATKGNPREDFEKPDGITYVKVSERTGKLPSEYTPPDDIKSEVFASFGIPKDTDSSFYNVVKIDKVSGKLATEFTPEAATENKGFFVHHSEFPDNPLWEAPVRKWAEDNHQDEVVPTLYDDIHTSETSGAAPSILITSPAADGTVSPPSAGVQVSIKSSGGIDHVEFFWDDTMADSVKKAPYKGSIKIPDDADATVPHVIKAVVYDTLYRTSEASVQVKIGADVNPPQVSFEYPSDGIKIPSGSSVSTQINASDADGDISKVEFYLDNSLSDSVKSSPYVWQLIAPESLGTHELKAIAYDFAGNKADATIHFDVIESSQPEQTDSSSITDPYSNQSFDQGSNILIKAAMSDESRQKLKELIVYAKSSLGKNIQIADAAGDPDKGGAYTYTFIWDTASAGNYDLYLKIILQDGTIRFSSKVPIVVK